MWPKNVLFEEAGDGAGSGSGSGADDKPVAPKSGKLKLDDNEEYDVKDLKSAISLYKALQDESTGREIIQTLAQRAGLLDKSGEVKKKPGESDKAAESRVAAALKKKLGKEYSQFADSVGPAFDEILDEMLAEKLGADKGERAQEKWEAAVDKFNSEYETTSEIEEAMKELIEEAPPNFSRKGFDPARYLARMYKAACEDLDEQPKIKTNRRGKGETARGRNSGAAESDGAPDIVIRDAPKGVTLEDAVEAAMKGIRFKRKEY